MRRSLQIFVRLVAILAAAIGIQYLCVAPYAGNRTLHRVDQRTHAAVIDPNDQRAAIFARASIGQLMRIAHVRKDEVTYDLLFAANDRILNRPDDALAHYDAALLADHRPEIYFERGLVLMGLGRKRDAIASLVTALRFDPNLVDSLDSPIREEVAAELQRLNAQDAAAGAPL